MSSHNHATVPFEPRHVVQMGCASPLVELAYSTVSKHPAWTAICRSTAVDTPFAAGGLVVPYPGMAELWTTLIPGDRAHAVYFYKEIKKKLPSLLEVFNLRRLQASVVQGHVEGLRLVRHLGFEYEATLRQYGPNGEDTMIFAITRD